jgi:glycosyltransferase involved in cell wall biosynthesis
VHGFSSPGILPAYRAAAEAGAKFVSISNADRAEGLPYVATIYHGIDVSQFPFRAHPGEHLVAFGRIHPDKGTADAIEIARRAGRPLIICGPVHDHDYYEERVKPHIDGEQVRYLGNVGPQDRAEVLGGAVALLHPIGFAEPFGLSVVEAMMCGTPVVAYPKGAMPELIEPGRTGLLVNSVEEAAEAVADAARLDREQVRAVAQKRFSAARMVDEYLLLYEKIVANT